MFSPSLHLSLCRSEETRDDALLSWILNNTYTETIRKSAWRKTSQKHARRAKSSKHQIQGRSRESSIDSSIAGRCFGSFTIKQTSNLRTITRVLDLSMDRWKMFGSIDGSLEDVSSRPRIASPRTNRGFRVSGCCHVQ